MFVAKQQRLCSVPKALSLKQILSLSILLFAARYLELQRHTQGEVASTSCILQCKPAMAATTRYVMMLKHGVRRSGGAVWLQQRSVIATHVGCVTTTAPTTTTRGGCVSSAALPHLARHRTLQRARSITTSTASHSGESFHTSQLPTLGGIRQHIKQDCARCVWGCARHCIDMNTQ